jgi:hypothetical protein
MWGQPQWQHGVKPPGPVRPKVSEWTPGRAQQLKPSGFGAEGRSPAGSPITGPLSSIERLAFRFGRQFGIQGLADSFKRNVYDHGVILIEDNAGTIAILRPDSSNLCWIDVNNSEAVILEST